MQPSETSHYPARCISWTCVAVFLIFNFITASASDTPRQAVPLTAGSPMQARMQAGEELVYSFIAEPGKQHLLEIDQGGFDLKVEVTTPGIGSQLFDFPSYRDESEFLLLEFTHAGAAEIRVFTRDFTGALAHPTLTLTDYTAAEKPLSAWRLLNQASNAHAEHKMDLAVEKLSAACDLLENLAMARQLARCLFGLATLKAWEEYAYTEAREMAATAQSLYGDLGMHLMEANAQQLRGVILVEIATIIEKTPSKGLAPEAQTIFNQALIFLRDSEQSHRQRGDRFERAQSLNLIGYTYYNMGDYAEAPRYYRMAAEIYRDLDEWQSEMMPVSNIAVIDFDRGYLINAVQAWERNLDLFPPDGSIEERTYLLNNLSAAYLALGQTDLALGGFSKALELSREIGARSEEGHALNGIGLTYVATGESELGMEYLERGLAIRRETNDGRGIVSALNALGGLYLEQGDIQSALAAHREAEITAASPRDRARAQLRLSEDLVEAGKPAEALSVLQAAGDTARKQQLVLLQADVHRLSGEAHLAGGDSNASVGDFQRALTTYEELLLIAEQSQCHYGLSRGYAAAGNLEQSVQHARAAIEAIETMRNRLTTPQLRAFFLSSRQEYFAQLISALLDLAGSEPNQADVYIRQALAISEQARARALVDLFSETAPDTEDEEQDAKQTELYRVLGEARYRLKMLLEEPPAAEVLNEIELTKQTLAETENALNLLEIERRQTDPTLAQLAAPTILDTDAIQSMLEPEMTLLQYSLGKESSHVFWVTRKQIRVWPLPAREKIETEARNLYARLSMPATTRADRQQLQEALAAFSSTILPPETEQLHPKLLIAADGVLQYLPFAALMSTQAPASPESLLENHVVVTLPSLSALAAIRQQNENDGMRGRDIALFADPVFSIDDPRFTTFESTPAIDVTLRQPGDSVEKLPRLPATAGEAQAIVGLVDPGQSLLATGFDASRSTVLDAKLDDYRIVHFATHGLIDSRYPALSALAFSQIDAQGNSIDSMLRLHDIYNVQLNADLVTLSACSTALGREISGEGLTGLTQGFMHAGSRAVLASLWQVPDRATSELMKRFYQNLLQQQQRPAEALRNAQMDLSSHARWRHPYYWGGFVLQGDWK